MADCCHFPRLMASLRMARFFCFLLVKVCTFIQLSDGTSMVSGELPASLEDSLSNSSSQLLGVNQAMPTMGLIKLPLLNSYISVAVYEPKSSIVKVSVTLAIQAILYLTIILVSHLSLQNRKTVYYKRIHTLAIEVKK